MDKICILGSINMDLVLNVKHMPQIGETILAEDLKKIPGGKGANQAVAASRLGSKVYMIGKTGKDENGSILLDNLKNDGVNTEYVFEDNEKPTGVAIITVDKNANNSIIVVSGANMEITKDDIYSVESIIKESKVIISQFEVPTEAIIEGFKIAKANGVMTILNPAPAHEIPEELLMYTDIIVPNETETFELTGIKPFDLKTSNEAGMKFIEKGVKYVIITLGDKGAALITHTYSDIIPSYKVDAVDTTAAGDAFIGAFATKVVKEDSIDCLTIKKAINYANKVSSIVVQRQGAQPSLPDFEEVAKIYGEE